MASPLPPVYQEYYKRSPFQLLAGHGLKRLLAFRADEAGITLCGLPVHHRRHAAFVPWQDIGAVVLWAKRTAQQLPMRYVGVKRRPGLPGLPGPHRGLGRSWAECEAPHIERQVYEDSRLMSFWRVDSDRLATAVQTFAPGVRLRFHPEYWKGRGSGGLSDVFDLM